MGLRRSLLTLAAIVAASLLVPVQSLACKASIEPMLRDVVGREMTHELTDEVVGEGRLSYNEHCEYPDGNRVFASVVCDLRDGKIVRQVQPGVTLTSEA